MSRDIVALQSSYADADEATYGSASMATMPMGSSFGLQHVGGSNTSARTTIAKEEAPPEYGRAAMLGQKVGYGTLSVCGCNDDEHISECGKACCRSRPTSCRSRPRSHAEGLPQKPPPLTSLPSAR